MGLQRLKSSSYASQYTQDVYLTIIYASSNKRN